MNKGLVARAEMLLVLQEYPVMTDRQTLKAATIIAHHNKHFQDEGVDKAWWKYFDQLAKMMREKLPNCPCKACGSKQKSV